MRKLTLFTAAFALATGAFWLTMLTAPPRSEASAQPRIDTRELTLKANPAPSLPYDPF